MNDQLCPKCGTVMNFSNQIGIEEETTEILGVVYLFKCKKCNTTFVSDMRFTKKASEEEIANIQKNIRDYKRNLKNERPK